MVERLRGLRPEARLQALAVVVWVAQPFTLGPLLGDAIDPARDGFRGVASWGAWAWWLIVLVALAVPRPVTLTVARIGAPAAVPAALWAVVEVDAATTATVGLVSAVVATITVLAPGLGDRFVDGVSYGDERRYVLRAPGPVLLGVLLPTWALTVAGVVIGPLLLADERWVAGALATAAGLPVALVGFRAILRLTARFVVFVPNGLVVHDRTVLREPVLFTRNEIEGFGPAPAGSAALDLTAAALGLALELRLGASATLPVVTGPTDTEETDTRAVLVAPSRPAAVLRTAQERGIRIA